ncbi:MAG: type V CRISPR-associated endonuclease Cas1 [Acholeplasmataceae bacterium]|nr:type V CRISPR-associated endonuclease Cas1 [Acholeplasmataceae bacterium]
MMSLPDFNYKQSIFYFPSDDKSKMRFRVDNIIIEDEQGKVVQQHSCHRIFALFIVGNITLTNVVLQKAKQFGFPVLLLSRNFRLDSYFNNRAEGNFLLRRKQYSAGERNLAIARQLVTQKINNQIALLQNLRYRSETDNEAISRLKDLSLTDTNATQELLGIEGNASKIFFPAYFRQMNWIRREPRTKRDINNLLLDIGYTYLFHFVEAMTAIYGFDVYCGVYHTFFYQRKSLVCDLVEPFRCIIDQRLRKAYNLKQIDENDFFQKNGQYHLEYKKQGKYTKLFMKDILEYKEDIFLYIQTYYRWFMKDKELKEFPVFRIKGGE